MGKKQKQPLVSVIIPTYNAAGYIKACLESVFTQVGLNSKFSIEVIIVDDGSTDNTSEILSQYDDMVRYERIENSGAPAKPRNLGVEISSGEYIAFLDADDIWFPHKLEVQVVAMESRPDIALLSSNAQIIDSDGRNTNKRVVSQEIVPKDYNFESLLRVNYLCTSGVLVRSKVLRSAGSFNEDINLRAVEDYELWLRIAAGSAISFMDKPLVGYRIHAANISKADGILAETRLIRVYESLVHYNLSGLQRQQAIRQVADHYRLLSEISGLPDSLIQKALSRYFALKAKLLYN